MFQKRKLLRKRLFREKRNNIINFIKGDSLIKNMVKDEVIEEAKILYFRGRKLLSQSKNFYDPKAKQAVSIFRKAYSLCRKHGEIAEKKGDFTTAEIRYKKAGFYSTEAGNALPEHNTRNLDFGRAGDMFDQAEKMNRNAKGDFTDKSKSRGFFNVVGDFLGRKKAA